MEINSIVRSLPLHAVRGVEVALPAAPLPFGTPALEGVVLSDDLILPQFDLAAALGLQGSTGHYALIVETSKGMIRLRVDAVSGTSTDPAADGQLAVEDVERLVDGYVAASVHLVPKAPVVDKRTGMIDLLIVRSGEARIALEATAIEGVERHLGIKPIRGEHDSARIVSLASRLLPGYSLGAWLDHDAPATEEGWAVVLGSEGKSFAVTVTDLLGLSLVSLDSVYTIEQDAHSSVWVADPKYGTIELIRAVEFEAMSTVEGKARPVLGAGSSELPKEADEVHHIASPVGAVGIAVSKYRFVLPTESVVEVIGPISGDRVAQKNTTGALPTYDLALAFDGKSTKVRRDLSRHALTIRKAGEAIVFLVPEIFAADDEPAWRPLPVVPSLVGHVAKAIRIRNDACELLVDADFFTRIPKAELTALSEATHHGWFQPAEFNSIHGHPA